MANEDLSRLKIDKTGAYRPKRSGKKIWLTVLILAALAGIFFMKGMLSPALQVDMVTVSNVYPSQAITLLNASGYVVAQRKAAVASKATGRLEWLGVEEGSKVRQGDVLARLENRDVVAAKDQAAANLAVAKASQEQAQTELLDATRAFNRQKELITQGIVAQGEFDAAEARFSRAKSAVSGAGASIRAAEAALRGAEVAIEYTLIRAPFDAVVLTKNADVGDIVTPLGAAANAKASVVTIADLGSLQVEGDVSESNLEKVKVGQPCEIQLDALPEARFRGAVHMIVPTADRSKASVLVKVRFVDKDARILPEMSAKVAFLSRQVAVGEQKPKVAVNPAVVASRDGKNIVFVLKGDKVVATPVTLGEKIGDLIEITGGVKAGEKLASRPLDKLKDGMKVKLSEK